MNFLLTQKYVFYCKRLTFITDILTFFVTWCSLIMIVLGLMRHLDRSNFCTTQRLRIGLAWAWIVTISIRMYSFGINFIREAQLGVKIKNINCKQFTTNDNNLHCFNFIMNGKRLKHKYLRFLNDCFISKMLLLHSLKKRSNLMLRQPISWSVKNAS